LEVSLWPRLAELPLVIEACEYERLHAVLAFEFERFTTHVRLVGGGTEGLGEDISAFREDGTTLHETRPSLPLAGEWTLAGFSEHLAALTLWPEPPEWEVALRMRHWAFESAALDLALRQAGRPLHEVLGLEPEPVRFVNSLGLGEVPSIEPLRRRLSRSPGVRFKLDAEASWPAALVDEVAATGAVDTIDFKGRYGLEVKDPVALRVMYDHVLAAFPDAYLEDPHDLPEVTQRLHAHAERLSYDAPIRAPRTSTRRRCPHAW
jgi:L-alanine-DL-glutamate epimerase-like enolase superfamily enzyme